MPQSKSRLRRHNSVRRKLNFVRTEVTLVEQARTASSRLVRRLLQLHLRLIAMAPATVVLQDTHASKNAARRLRARTILPLAIIADETRSQANPECALSAWLRILASRRRTAK